MSRRRDPLRTVLRLRGIRERQVEAEMADAARRVAEARQRLEEHSGAAQSRRVPTVELEAVQLRALQLAGMGDLELIEAARAELAETTAKLQEARERWAATSAARKSAERLAERRELDSVAAALRAGQQSLDELVLLARERENRR